MRPAQAGLEAVLANCRPQPALPAVLVFMLTLLLAMSAARNTGDPNWMAWLVPLGVLASAGLAVGAGFCSLFPQTAWLLLAVWGLPALTGGGPPAVTVYVVYLGMAAVVIMFAVQLWRIATRRFVPTIAGDP
ncbi:MAG: hypothetical protein V2J12_05945 [Gammaproteobacteria bacterium]|jgi:hypothetical protein|nr:hypothetical protein [Gammaproteobacteria bacterium]